MTITELLFSMRDTAYRDFSAKLMPTVDKSTVIGVRVSDLRKTAKKLDAKDAAEFMKALPHRYYEENNLHAFLICSIKDFDLCISELNKFLPYVDNWATCDSIRPACFKNEKTRLFEEIEIWIKSEHTYTVRFAIEMLMTHFLDSDFSIDIHNLVLGVISDEYYIKMMVAWYFATALAKQWESTVRILEDNFLPQWIHNKTIQKAIESYRITNEQKLYLRTLKRKTTA